jgi:Rrf2 family protein
MIELAHCDGASTGVALAHAQGIPPRFLKGILAHLCHAGLVTSQRGQLGGYRLARGASAITVADVITVFDGPITTIRGEAPQDIRYAGSAVPLQALWIATRASILAVLETVTIADLATGRLPDGVHQLAPPSSALRLTPLTPG